MFRSKFFQAYGFWHWGEGLQTVLFTWYMTFHAGLTAAEIGFYQALVLSPFLIFTIAGGALTDRIGARKSFAWSTLLFALVLAGYGLADHGAGFLPWAFFAYCLLAGITSAVSNPAIDTFIPGATPQGAQANALLAATAHNIAKLSGTLTGLLLPWLLALGGFGLNAVLMAMSVAMLSLHFRSLGRTPAPRLAVRAGSSSLRGVLQHYRTCPENFDILLSSAMLGLLVVPAGYILWPLLLRERFPEYGGMIALLFICSWIGAISITWLAGRHSARLLRPGRLALLVWLAWAGGLAALVLAGSFWAMCAIVMLMGGGKLGKALVYGKYLHNSPADARGVLIAVDQTAFWGLAALGTFAMGQAAERLGAAPAMLLVSALVSVCVLLLAARRQLTNLVPA
ncbi:membrane protein [Leisingera sp. ANG-M1]|uniref:MFS transporter n=1 Tax=Leisingera sp. ANG-M1 TaxID=1577895 RepID=UPI00057E1BC4|nr:MFS transporter [Leisingera sp. ANG-M1]KIC10938.1 membrane protein [Leisingera sp. ANG-M1]